MKAQTIRNISTRIISIVILFISSLGISAKTDMPNLTLLPVLHASSYDESKSYYRLYLNALHLKQYNKAALYGEAYCKFCIDSCDWQNISFAKDLNNLAFVKNKVGCLKEAIDISNLTLWLRRELLEPSHPDFINTLHNLAVYYKNAGEYEKAIELRKEQYTILSQLNQIGKTIYSAMDLVSLYIESGRFSEALTIIDDIGVKYELSSIEQSSLKYLHALALNEFGKYSEAHKIACDEFEKILKSNLSDNNRIKYLELVCATCIALGRYEDVELYINKFADIENLHGLKKSVLLNNLADATRDTMASITLRKEAIEEAIYSHETLNLTCATIMTNLSNVLAQNDSWEEALTHALKAREILKEIKLTTTPNYINALHALAICELNLNNHPSFLNYLSEELNTLDAASNINFINSSQTDKFDYLSRYIDIKDLAIYGSLESSTPEISGILYDIALKYKRAIFTSENNLRHLENFSTLRNFVSVRDALKTDEIAVEFATTIDGNLYVACVIRKDWDAPKSIFLGDLGSLELYLDNPNEIYNNTSLQSVIWRLITEEGNIKRGETIYFSPDGILNKIAIEYLPLPTGELMTSAYNCHRLSSTSVICDKREKFIVTSPCIVTTPEIDDTPYSSLDNNRGASVLLTDEESGIIQSLSIKHGIVMDSKQILNTYDELEGISNNDLIHVSTHGHYAEPAQQLTEAEKFEWGQSNSVLFINTVQNGKEKNVISAKDVSLLNLNSTNLVVLAACESNLGTYTFDGVSGLNRGFFLAGVKSSISSLWNVNDAITLKFVELLYDHLFSGHSPWDALKKSILEIKDLTGEPIYWAPFVLTENVIFF